MRLAPVHDQGDLGLGGRPRRHGRRAREGWSGLRCLLPRAAYDYDCYRSNPLVDAEPCPEAERAAHEVVSLPVHPYLSDNDIEKVCAAVTELASGS
ncbi:MAG: DegT/DnrJ/EryC1/StrS family aminotransferase [Microthrixaceae bacterium]